MEKRYSIGVDYGTQSGRAVIVDVSTGEIKAQVVKNYTHGVMDESLPNGTKLATDWALEHPADYLEVLETTIPKIIEEAKVNKEQIIGLSIDFTSCTMLPVDSEGTPLCLKEKYSDNPHAWVKLWKHHAAQSYADRLNDVAAKRDEDFLKRNGGKISCEFILPKIMQILEEAPKIYEATDRFMEAGDWLTYMLTGEDKRNSCMAGFKALWSKAYGYPSEEFYNELDTRLRNVVKDKLSEDVYSIGSCQGRLSGYMAKKLNLCEGTPVGYPVIDAHVAMPALGITKPGKLLMIMGTSTCDILLSDREIIVPGMNAVVEDGVIPGYYAYEAGQACVGDSFEWFIDNLVPESYMSEAKRDGKNIHQFLMEKAEKLKPLESGLLALDWWNGNRSVLADYDLTGMILGMTLATKPEEIYRAMIEATAFGNNMIIETFEENGIKVDEIYASGGISKKNRMMMQIYADVTGKEIFIGASDQSAALGSAMFGAVAAGALGGGYDNIKDAADKMGRIEEYSYKPIKENHMAYKKLYAEYKKLHDYFGRGGNDVMKRLKGYKSETKR